MLNLYTDGGVIKKNPSSLGGTYAWILVDEDDETILDSGFGTISPDRMGTLFVTNNQTELYALLKGLKSLYDGDIAQICSDSEITLGRVFKNYSFTNIPNWMQDKLKEEKKRLQNFSKFTYTLMDGHPTLAQLESGIGKRGHTTSKWNKWCDEHCNEASRIYVESIQ